MRCRCTQTVASAFATGNFLARFPGLAVRNLSYELAKLAAANLTLLAARAVDRRGGGGEEGENDGENERDLHD